MKRRDLLKLLTLSYGVPLFSCREQLGIDPTTELPDCLGQDTTKLIFEPNPVNTKTTKIVLIERTTSPLLIADKPWESKGITYSNVLKIDEKWKMWYSALDKNSESDYETNLCYAESSDGINWIKPNLKKIKFNNNDNNNIIMNGDVHGATVFYDANAPLSSRYKIVFTKFRNEIDGNWLYGMSSEDGITFENLVLLSKTNSDTQSAAFFDGDKYRFYLRYWDGGQLLSGRRTIAYSECSTFGTQCIPTPIEILNYGLDYSKDLYNNGVSKLRDNLYVMFPSVFDHASEEIIPHLAIGENGMNFNFDEKEFLPLGKDFDSSAIYVAPGCIQGDSPDKFIFYYSGRSLQHSSSFDQLTNTYNGGIGRFIVQVN